MYMSRSPRSRMGPLKVLIVDDHPLFGDALQAALQFSFESAEFRRAATLAETLEILADGFAATLIVFDLKLPDVTGISGFHKLKRACGEARVLVVSSLASGELVRSLLEGGADGFLPKDAASETLQHAITEIVNGRRYVPQQFARVEDEPSDEQSLFTSNPELSALTGQQIRILKLICAGMPNKQIAHELTLAEATVKAHITALLRRLGVQNRTQAVVAAEAALQRHGNGAPEAQAFLNH